MLTLLRPHRASITISLVALCAATALILLQPLLAGQLVDRAAAGKPILLPAAGLLAMLIGHLTLESLGHFRLDRVGEQVVLRLRADFTDHVVRLPISVLDRVRTGDLLSRGASDASLLRDMPRAAGDVVFGMLTLLGAGLCMIAIDPLTPFVVAGVLAAGFIAGNPFLSKIQNASLSRQDALGDYTAGLDRALGAARTVKLYGAEDREVKSIGASAQRAYQAGVRVALATAVNIGAVRLGITGSFLVIMIVDGHRVAAGGLSAGEFVSLFAFSMYAIFPINAAFVGLTALRTAAGAYEHLTATLQELPEDDTPAAVGAVTTARGTESGRPTEPLAEFDHVSFRYAERWVLDDVSFTIGRNQVTALIGPSGAGKSTILALLCRFHDPTAGTVRWEGDDVRGIALRELRGRLGLLEQDAPVLHGTIRDNLLIADPGATEADLWRVLEQANIAGEIDSLPTKLDTSVLDRGRGLSGGQRQRLALARALLSRSELILMDEPTAHLDRANEYDVMTNPLQARGRRSLLVVAHRLSTVTHADQILVLQQGRIQAGGTHAELMSSPAYRDLVEHELLRQ